MLTGTRLVIPSPYQVTVEEYDVMPPEAGQLLIENEASAISAGTELSIYTGVHQHLNDPTRAWPKFPFIPGYSGVGRVMAVGQGVSGYEVGERVIYPSRHESHGIVDLGHRESVLPIAKSVPAEIAAFAMLTRFPLTSVVQSGQVLGQAVVVVGLGMIGQLALRLFAAAGAYPIIGVDPVQQRRSTAERIPCVVTVDPSVVDPVQFVPELNHGALPDIVVDATGVPDVIMSAMSLVADGGKVILLGSPRGKSSEVDFYRDLHARSIQLIGAHGSALGLDPRERLPFILHRGLRLLVHFFESRRLVIEDLITHVVPYSQGAQAYEGLLKDRDNYVAVAFHP